MKKFTLIIYALIFIHLTGCASNPTPPANKPASNQPKTELSTIEIPISIPYRTIEDPLNQELPQELYRVRGQHIDCPYGITCTLQVIAKRRGQISVVSNGDRVKINIPLILNLRVDAKKGLFRSAPEVNADVIVSPTLDLNLMPDWSVVPKVTLNFEVRDAVVNLFHTNVSVRDVTEKLLNSKYKGDFEKLVMQALHNKIKVGNEINMAWSQLHVVKKIIEEPSAWISVDPVSIKLENPKATPSGLHIGVGIDAYIAAYLQDQPPPKPVSADLPLLTVVDKVVGNYKIALPMRISIDEVNKVIKGLEGKKFDFKIKNKTIIAKLVEGSVYANGNEIVVYSKIKVDDFYIGIFPLTIGAYINGTPQFDSVKKIVYFKPFNYEVATTGELEDIEWFFHEKIREHFENSLVFNISDKLSNLKQSLSNKVREIRIGENIVLNGTVDNIAPDVLYVTKDYLNVNVAAQGHLSVNVK